MPDDIFEQKLIDMGHDDVLDDYVLTSNISGVTYLHFDQIAVSNMTGIEDFISLETLYFRKTNLTSLDVSKNIALAELTCYENKLTSLDVSKNTALTELNCSGNQIISLDISKNVALTRLYNINGVCFSMKFIKL